MNKTQMLKGILDWCVLSILKKNRVYSQEIVALLKDYGFENITDGTLFPLLLRLEKDCFVKSEKIENSLGASRKYYFATELGLRALNNFKNEWSLFKNSVDNILIDSNDVEI